MSKKKFVCVLIFVVLIFAIACSMGGEAVDSSLAGNYGAISMTLPQSPAAQGLTSASIASDGSLENENVSTFKIYVRNFTLQKEIIQDAKPGSTIAIDELEPGIWSVSIRGLDSEGGMLFYGKSVDIIVTAGQTASAAIGLNKFASEYLAFALDGITPDIVSNICYASISCECGQLNQSDEVFYNCSSDLLALDQNNRLPAPAPLFMEPGYSYTIKASFYSADGQVLWDGSSSQTIPENGGEIQLSESFSRPEYYLSATPTWEEEYIIGNDLPSYLERNIPSFSVTNGESASETNIPLSDVTIKALETNYCGFVPIFFTYKDYSWCAAMRFLYPVTAPTLSMVDEISIPVGITRSVASLLSTNPSTPATWKVFGLENHDGSSYDKYGFSKFCVTEETDSDTWTTELSLAEGDVSQYISTYDGDDDKTIYVYEPTSSPESCKWTLTATGSFSYGGEQIASSTKTFGVNGVQWNVVAPSDVTLSTDFVVTLTNIAATEEELTSVANDNYLAFIYDYDTASPSDLDTRVVKDDNSIVVTVTQPDAWNVGDQKAVTITLSNVEIGTFTVLVGQGNP